MLNLECISCRRTKPTRECESCQEPVCKDCVHFLEASTFSFLKKVPEELTHSYYCQACNDTILAPALESYNETMEQAKKVYFFFHTQRKHIPLKNKSKETYHVEECADRDETILRLAFFAAEHGYNAIVNAEVTSKKVRNEGYQKSAWKGLGYPANVDADKLERHYERP
jgi:hypothetical protein